MNNKVSSLGNLLGSARNNQSLIVFAKIQPKKLKIEHFLLRNGKKSDF